jgi:YD repeat-containing protein
MRKYSLVITLLVFVNVCFSQNPEINTELPSLVPPSPTVSALMKFEEVPVSNYTGVPDVSIPLYSTTTKHGLEVNISLSYHPSSIKKDDISGFTGLGWSLIAGGTISRTVRDIPDECYDLAKRKIGIYHNASNPNQHRNNYYDVIPLLNSNYNFNTEDEEINRFLFETNEKNLFDSKHDLYQFNFMGYTGRFIIEKKPNGSFEVVKLAKNNLIINYNATNQTFQIKDTKGFTYVFDVKEESSGQTITSTIKLDNTINDLVPFSNPTYISAFQLSKILYNDEIEVLFNYNLGVLTETQIVRNETHNIPIVPTFELLREMIHQQQQGDDTWNHIEDGFLPLEVRQNTTTTIETKKISQINIIGKAIIDFNILNGLNYSYPVNPKINHCLNSVVIKDLNNNIIKSYAFSYLFKHKLFLNEIKEGFGSNEISKYLFKYQDLDIDYSDFISDYWGYYKFGDYETDCINYSNRNRDTDKVYCKKDVLKQIIYPTKGSTVFEYEPNTYSYVGDFPIPETPDQLEYSEDFTSNNSDNHTNTYIDTVVLSSNYSNSNNQLGTGSATYDLGVFSTNTTYIFNSIFTGVDDDNLGFLYLTGTNGTNSVSKGLHTNGCNLELKLKAGYHYHILFNWSVAPPHNVSTTITINEKTMNSNTNKWLYGGGVRIKNIYYTVDHAPEVETQNYPNTYSKKVSFKYNFFDDLNKSSGSLVYPKPKLQYETLKKIDLVAIGVIGQVPTFGFVKYSIFSNTNNLSFLSTKGGEVGYKNVTVTESGNGKTEFEYLSPIDYPEHITYPNIAFPFAPTPNVDYKRGLLRNEKKYNELGRPLTEKTNSYSFENHEKITGVSTYYKSSSLFAYDCPYTKYYLYYYMYRSSVLAYNWSDGDILRNNAYSCGEFISDFVTYYQIKEAFGWAKLDNTLLKEYFYDSSGNQSQLDNSISYTYNPINMQLASQTSSTSIGVNIERKYYYSIDPQVDSEPQINALRNNNRVETPIKIESFKAGNKISEQKTVYKDWGNGMLAPEIIQDSKGTLPLENRILYNMIDNTNGNPLEVQQENGMKISYIYGYNKSQPVAKLENIVYSNIPANLITAIQSATDSPNSNEAQVIDALNALRTSTDANLQKAMITTYTYKPLIGVSTITDPKGDKITYIYDAFNRLKEVRDKDNNVLSENHYNYRP